MKSIVPFVLLLLATALVGCGAPPGKASVKGKVHYGSKPVKFGEVVIFGGDGIPKTVKISRDGTYEVTEVMSGDGRIAVRSTHPKETASLNRDEKAPPDPVDVKNWFALPPVYADPNSSGQTLKIAPGENAHDITLPEKS